MVTGDNDLLHKLSSKTSPFVPPSNVFLLTPRDRTFFNGRPPLVPFNLNVLLAVGLLVIFSLGGLCLLYSLNELYIFSQLNAARTTAQGEIIARRTEALGRFRQQTSYYVTYRFTPPDQNTAYVKDLYVYKDTYERLKEGTVVTVNYLPGNPNISLLSGEDVAPNIGIKDSVLAAVGVITMLTCGLYLLPLLRHMWTEARLRQQGCLIAGHVLACRRYFTLPVTSLPPGDHDSVLGAPCYIELTYGFHTPQGKQLRGVGYEKRSDLARTRLPTFGAPVVILYVDEKHHRVL